MWAVARRVRRVVAVPTAAPVENGAESALQPATEVQAVASTPAHGEPETNLVGSPQSVFRDSETIVEVAAPDETPRSPD